MLTRRQLLKGSGAFTLLGASLGGYAVAVEVFRLEVRQYRLSLPRWADGPDLRIAVLADLHACEPWMPAERIAAIVAQTNALEPDLVVLLGDFVAGSRLQSRPVANERIAEALSDLKAPLGTFAVLGNHDWWQDPYLQVARKGPTPIGRALEAAGVPVLENAARRLVHNGRPFWLAGLGDQWAFYRTEDQRRARQRFDFEGVDDLPATLAAITDDAPAILLAHEPDVFAELPDRFALQLSGHTHGGQVQLLGWTPVVPSRYGSRYVYGHVTEPAQVAVAAERHLIVSGGLGCSGLPMRFGRPPELVVVDLVPPWRATA